MSNVTNTVTQKMILEALDASKKNPDTDMPFTLGGQEVTFKFISDEKEYTAEIGEGVFRSPIKKMREFSALLLTELTNTVETSTSNVAPSVPADMVRMPANTLNPPEAPLVNRDATASAAYSAMTGKRVRVTKDEQDMMHKAEWLNNEIGSSFRITRSEETRYVRAAFDLHEGATLLMPGLLAKEITVFLDLTGKRYEMAQAAETAKQEVAKQEAERMAKAVEREVVKAAKPASKPASKPSSKPVSAVKPPIGSKKAA